MTFHRPLGDPRPLDAVAAFARSLRQRADTADASIVTGAAFVRCLADLGVPEADRAPRDGGRHPDAVAWEWFRCESFAFCAGRLWLRVEADPEGLRWRKTFAHYEGREESGNELLRDGALVLSPRFAALLRAVALGEGGWYEAVGDGSHHWSYRPEVTL